MDRKLDGLKCNAPMSEGFTLDRADRHGWAVGFNVDRGQRFDSERLKRENHELKLRGARLVRLPVSKGVLKPGEVDATVSAVQKN